MSRTRRGTRSRRPRPVSVRRHRFGAFLVDKGVVDEATLFDALNEQRARRIPIGKLATVERLLTVKQVMAVLREQAGTDRRFGRIAVDLGYLSEAGLFELLELQDRRCPRIGEILVERGHLTAAERDNLLAEFLELAQ